MLFHKGPQQCRLSHFAEPRIRAGVQQGSVYWGLLSPAQWPVPVWPPLTLLRPWRLRTPWLHVWAMFLGPDPFPPIHSL